MSDMNEDSDEVDTPPEPMDRHQIMGMSVLVEGLLVPGAFLVGWWAGFDPMEKLVFTWADMGWGLGGGIVLALVVMAVLLLPFSPIKAFKGLMERHMFPMLAASTYPDRVGIALLAGFCEELLFRGAIQPALGMTLLGPWGALIISSVLFGALHGLSGVYFFLAMGISLILGGLYQFTDNLLGPMILHGVYDLIILLLTIPYEPLKDDGSGESAWEDGE